MRHAIVALSLFGCTGVEPEPAPAIVPGVPEVGAAAGTMDLPIGTPMGGYSARANYLGALSQQDSRQSAYNQGFVESTGIHMRPGMRVIWLTNGDQDLVLTQSDTIYSFDGLVDAVTKELERRTGRDLDGRVAHTTNHSHNSYGPFSDQVHFYLGGDRYNEEIFQRYAGQMVELAMTAYETRVPASIGVGWSQDWDPNDTIYRDRRGDNNELVMFDDLPPGGYGKDPFLQVMRFDAAADGSPIALTYAMPIHGTLLEGSMLSPDAGGGITAGLEDEFDRPVVVMQLQTAGGDASPAGRSNGMPRVESLAMLAPPLIMELYDQIATSDAPISMETASRHIWQEARQIEVTRDGTVDWRYAPMGPDQVSDSVVWNEDGTPGTFDEFNAPNGAVFCGSGDPLIPGGGVYNLLDGTEPYPGCVRVDAILPIIQVIFELTEEESKLPMREAMKAGTLATRIGPIPTLHPDGTSADEPMYAAFFPAEPTSMFVEQFRRRARAELGYAWPLLVGYSQDHEGYFLPPEDWLSGGYEPNINMWGPLQGEHVMEGVLQYSEQILGTTDLAEEEDPDGYFSPTEYISRSLPTEFVPDTTDEAGTILTASPSERFWVPESFVANFAVPATVPRVQGVVQFAWQGGDVMVDLPDVVLEKQDGTTWAPVTTGSGRQVTDASYDMLMGHTPEPLYPVTGDQTHNFWVGWQAVPHTGDRAALPLGTYRLHVYGEKYAGGSTQWPWNTAPYEVLSPEFEVVPAAITVTHDAIAGISVSLQAPPEGWRMLDLDGDPHGSNPVRGDLTVELEHSDASVSTVTAQAEPGGHLTLDLTDVVRVTVADANGNTGTWTND